MKIVSIFFIIFLFIKSFVYSMFELTELENRNGGIFIMISSIIAFILSFLSICIF